MSVVKPFIITPRMEEILQTVHYYRYMTALDVTYRLFSPNSLAHVREILKALCGGADAQDNHYLFRFPLPQFAIGKTEKVFTLGHKGRDFLTRELGFSADWYFRPQHIKHLSHGLINHNLTLTRFLVAASYWCKNNPGFTLAKTRISYEMEKEPGRVGDVKVIPDGWLLFMKGETRYPVLVEIDRGTEFKERFKRHIKTRIELLKGGEYQRMFGERGGLIVYATTGKLPQYREYRAGVMCEWAKEALSEMNLKRWASILRFTSIERERLYETPLFEGKLWRRPDDKTLLPLLAD